MKTRRIELDTNVKAIYRGLMKHGYSVAKVTQKIEGLSIMIGSPKNYQLANNRGIIRHTDVIEAILRGSKS